MTAATGKAFQARAASDTIGAMQTLRRSFWTFVACWGLSLLMGLERARPELFEKLTPLLLIAALLMVASLLAYLVALGNVVARSGRNWVGWVGLTILTFPIGVIVSYLAIRARVTSLAPSAGPKASPPASERSSGQSAH